MNKELYDGLEPKEKAFAELLLEVSRNLKRLADLMEKEILS